LDKRARMKYLLEEIEERKEILLNEFFSYVEIKYGIRKTTCEEYLRAWLNGGYICIHGDTIKFVKKPQFL